MDEGLHVGALRAEVAEQVSGNFRVGIEPVVEAPGFGQRLVVQKAKIAVQFLGHHEVVGHDDDGGLEQHPHVVDQRKQIASVVVVQTCRGFVHEQELRVHCPGTGDGHTLLHTGTQLVGEQSRLVTDAHQVHGHVDLFLDFSRASHLVIAQGKGDVVADTHIGNECPVLEHETYLTFRDFQGGKAFGRNVFPEVVDASLGRAHKSRHNTEQRTLSLTGTSANAERFALFDDQVCPADQFVLGVVIILAEEIKGPRPGEHGSCQVLIGKVDVFESQGYV